MNKIICDRCGKDITKKSRHTIATAYLTPSGNGPCYAIKYDEEKPKMDLCPECYDAFKEFLGKHEEEDTQAFADDDAVEEFTGDINSILKKHFSYVSLYTLNDFVKQLTAKGWRFEKKGN